MNSTGKILVLTTFGESHGTATGGVLDGFPPGITVDNDLIISELKRRSTGRSLYSSSRKEDDIPEILSGIFDGKTTGAPIAFIVKNTGHISGDYDHLADVFRPSHADFTYEQKYGIRDYRGGGRSSARETVARVIGGAFAKMFLNQNDIKIMAWTSQIGNIRVPEEFIPEPEAVSASRIGCPHKETETKSIALLRELKQSGDSTGGVVSCVIKGVPAGTGEPVFDKLHADLGKAMLSINAVKGFEYGSGFAGAAMKGSEHNDIFFRDEDGKIKTVTNNSGGIQGGISNGMDIDFRVAFKPVPSIMKVQETVDRNGNKVTLKGKGRYDVCVVPRAIVIVEAMAALVIADHLLRHRPV